jgi:hypothetical protein
MVSIYLRTMCFAFAPHTILPEAIKHLSGPGRERIGVTALAYAMAFVTLCYLAVSIPTYAAFGCHIVGDILTSPLFPRDGLWTLATVCITLHVSVTCPIFTSGAMARLEDAIGMDSRPDRLPLIELSVIPNPTTNDVFLRHGKEVDQGDDTRDTSALLASSAEPAPVPMASSAPARTWGHTLKSVALRTLLWFLCLLVALFLPFFGQVMELLGGMTMFVCVPVPAWFWLRSVGRTSAVHGGLRAAVWATVALGIVISVGTTALSMADLWRIKTGNIPSADLCASR